MSKVIDGVKTKVEETKEKIMNNKKALIKKAVIIGAAGTAAFVAVKKFKANKDEEAEVVDWNGDSEDNYVENVDNIETYDDNNEDETVVEQ